MLSNQGRPRSPTSRDALGWSVARAANPLAPCGACQEWLKKIAEVQPAFKVVSFTDETCSQVYVKSVRTDW
jgi:cytidine deaminase